LEKHNFYTTIPIAQLSEINIPKYLYYYHHFEKPKACRTTRTADKRVFSDPLYNYMTQIYEYIPAGKAQM